MKVFVIGYKTDKRSEIGKPIYCGADNMEAEAAIVKSSFKRFEIFRNVMPTRVKHASQYEPKAVSKIPRDKLVDKLRKRREQAEKKEAPEVTQDEASQRLTEAEKRIVELEREVAEKEAALAAKDAESEPANDGTEEEKDLSDGDHRREDSEDAATSSESAMGKALKKKVPHTERNTQVIPGAKEADQAPQSGDKSEGGSKPPSDLL